MSEKLIRILLIEDDLGDARLIREMLTGATQPDLDIPGFDVVRTVKLATGLKRLRKGDIDVILLNLSLPDSQGLDTFTEVHTRAPEVPVVILSAPEDKALAVEAVRKGAQDHLVKGQTSGDLLMRSIHYALKRAQRAEEALRAERDLSKGVLDALVDTVFVFDPETGKALRWNSAFREISGYTDEEISSRNAPDDWYSNQDLEKTAAEIDKLSRGEKSVIEMALITKDGKRVPTEYSAAIVHDPASGSPYIVAVGRNISERVRTEKALRIQRDLGVALSSTSDLTEALNQVLDAALQMEEIDSGGVYLVDALTGELDLAVHAGMSAEFIENVSHYAADAPNTQLILAGEPIYIHGTDFPPGMREPLQREGLRASAVIPVIYEGHAIAALNLASHVHDEIPTSTRHALEAIGTQVGGVIARLEAVRALQASERHYRIVSELTSDIAYAVKVEPDGTTVPEWVAGALARITGFSVNDLVARGGWPSILHPDDLPLAFKHLQVHLTGQPDVAEYRIVTKDGEVRWLRDYGYPMWDETEGRVVRVIGAAQDITERKQAEKALQESRRRLQAIFDQTFQFMGVMTLDGTLTEVNQTALDFADLEESDVIGKPFWETPWWTHSPELQEQLREAIGRAASGEFVRFEANHLAADGSLHYADFSLKPVWDETGNVSFLIPEGRDVTERVHSEQERAQAERALRESEERHRLVSELTTDYTFRLDIDADGNAAMSLITENYFTATGRTLEEAKIPDQWATIFHPDDLERAMALLRDVVSSGQPAEVECRTYVKSGRQRWVQLLAQPIWDEEEQRTVAILGAVKDITQRKQAQEALQYRVEFEGLITDISTQFINLASDEVDSGIDRALQAIGGFTGVDRSYVFLFRNGGATMDNTHEWCAEGIEPQIQRIKGVPTADFQWSLERVRRSEVIHIPRVADLPPEASAEREEFQATDIQSLIMVPIVYGRTAIGFLGLDSVRVERTWSEDTIALLKIVGEIFANALERKQVEEALRESEARNQALLSAIPDPMFRFSHTGVFLDYKTTDEAGLYAPPDTFLGKTLYDVFPIDLAQQAMGCIEQAVRTQEIQALEYELPFDGRRRAFEARMVASGEDQVLVIVRDVTERKQAMQQIEHLNHLQGELLNPLSLTEKLDLITENVVSILDADFARIWIIQPGDLCESGCIHAQVTEGPHVCRHRDRCLHLLSSSGRYTHIDGEMHRRVPFGCYKIGRVASGEDPKSITNDVVHDPRVHDHEWTRELGLTSFAGYRLKSTTGEIVGVLALFSKHVISPGEDALIEGLANTTAQIIQTTQAEEALERSEATLRSIFRVAPVGIFLVLQRELLLVNDRICEMLGYSSDELIGKNARVLYPTDEDFEYVGREKSAQIEERGTGTVETRWQHKDGKVFDILLGSTPIDPSTPSKGITFTALDITERKQAEEALRESEERYRELANSITDVFFAVDKELRYTYWNTASEQLTGLAAKDALGRSIQEVFPDDESTKEMVQAYETVLKTQKPQAFVTGRHLAGAGFFEISAYPSKDGISVFAKDITERKQAEEERERLLTRIQKQAQRVQQIIDIVPEGVILLDADARIVLANPLGRKDLTVLADTLVGGTLTRLGDRPLEAILTPPPQELWHEISAEGRDFQVIARPVSEATEAGPTPGGWVLVIRDVTKQREIERHVQQQERLAAVGQLAAGIAHDFNNIMAVITLYAGMSLRTPDVPQTVHERLETINQQAQRASELIQQIMDFSRRAVLERGPMDLLAFMKEQVKLLKRTLPENIEINLNYGKDEYTIRADLTRIQQVIMNLATNARDAMPLGGELHITLERVRLEQSDVPPISEMKAGEWVCVQVTDTGSGISDDVLPHIFNPFFTTKEPGKGTGLGLAQVYGIISQHEGHVDVRTQTGKGTTFILYLPALSVDQPEAPSAKTGQLPQGQGQTILVVEDDTTTRAAVVGSLGLLGYQILEAANGREALAIFEQHATQADRLDRIALVLSDVVMPEMGGQALFYTLKQQNPDVKVLLLTGHPLEEEGLAALLAHGLKGWLPKPPSLERLAEAVAQVLGEK